MKRGLPSARCDDELARRPGHRGPVDQLGHHLRGLVLGERIEHPGAGETRGCPRPACTLAVGAQQEDRLARQAVHHAVEVVARAAVDPLQIFHEQERDGAGRRAGQRAHRVHQALLALRAASRPLHVELVGGQRQHVLEVGMVHSSAEVEPADAGLHLVDLLLLALAVLQHEVHLQELGDEVERQRLAVLVTAAGQERDGVLGQPALEARRPGGTCRCRRDPPPTGTLPRPRWVLSKASRRKASARWRPTKAVSPRSSARSKRARPLIRRVAVKVGTGRAALSITAGGLDHEVATHQAHGGFA